MKPTRDGSRYETTGPHAGRFGIIEYPRIGKTVITTGSVLYEADFSQPYAQAMCDWLNKNGFVDFETLRTALEENGISE